MKQIHTVFGATGALRAAVVKRLAIGGKPVCAVVRNEAAARLALPKHQCVPHEDGIRQTVEWFRQWQNA